MIEPPGPLPSPIPGPIRVLLTCADPQQSAAWRAGLAGEEFECLAPSQVAPPQVAPPQVAAPEHAGPAERLELPAASEDHRRARGPRGATGRAGSPRPDVLLAELQRQPALDALTEDLIRRGETAIVWIGSGAEGGGRSDSGDDAAVVLPADWTPRELRLACRLQGRLARERRARRATLRAARRWARRALTDPLTRLANRRAFHTKLRERCRAAPDAPEMPGPPALLLFDIDHFKQVNDRFGHAVGDEVLCRVAAALAGEIGRRDDVARLGGDEFGVLLAGCETADWRARMERLRRAACLGDPELPTAVTVSAGGAPPGTLPRQLYRSAAEALRQAKQQGRDRSVAAG